MQFLGLMAGLFGLDILLKGKIEAGDKEDFPRDMEGKMCIRDRYYLTAAGLGTGLGNSFPRSGSHRFSKA